MKNTYSIMTFNVRLDTPIDEENRFFGERCEFDAEFLSKCDADIICFQEVSDEMRAFFRKKIGDKYDIVGCGREDNFRGEATPIAYRRDMFELIGLDAFWLAATPNLPGSSMYFGDCPRVCIVATLLPNNSSTPIRVYNTHLFYVPEDNYRRLGLLQVLERMKADRTKFMTPVVLCGDFNAEPTFDSINVLRKSGFLKDATEGLGRTFQGFGHPDCDDFKIDYIWTDGEVVPGSPTIITDRNEHGIYLSDHNPVMAKIIL